MKRLRALPAICLSFMVLACSSHSNGWDPPAHETKLKAQIETEISSLKDHAWAGSYYEGDGTGVNINLTIAPQNGFTITWQGCLGLYGHNYGSVVEKDGQIMLVTKLPNEEGKFGNFDTAYFPVRWGQRHYLVGVNRMAEFCNQVNSRYEPRDGAWGMTLLRSGDEDKKVGGSPELPEKYKRWILSKPIDARILNIGPATNRGSLSDEFHFIDHEIIVDAGAIDGVFEGMEFTVVEPNSVYSDLTITNIELETSKGVYSYMSSDPGDSPKETWKLSTRR
ncbi:MAG: hypothetical protein IT366_18055 [Candidatus Hydrogenedentes bacterium]|nr:hypothetical protein [Candidatus Hydrogenedentota bacterium]